MLGRKVKGSLLENFVNFLVLIQLFLKNNFIFLKKKFVLDNKEKTLFPPR